MSTIQDLIDYVRETPENTNPAVIKTIAQNLENGDGDAITVAFTFDEETEEWESDWTFDDLYTELSKNVGTFWGDGHSVNVKVTDDDGYHESRAFPVIHLSENTLMRKIELWINYGKMTSDEYQFPFFEYNSDGLISKDLKSLAIPGIR